MASKKNTTAGRRKKNFAEYASAHEEVSERVRRRLILGEEADADRADDEEAYLSALKSRQESQRKIVMWGSVFGIMSIVIIGWAMNIRAEFYAHSEVLAEDGTAIQDWEKFKQEMGSLLETAKEQFSELPAESISDGAEKETTAQEERFLDTARGVSFVPPKGLEVQTLEKGFQIQPSADANTAETFFLKLEYLPKDAPSQSITEWLSAHQKDFGIEKFTMNRLPHDLSVWQGNGIACRFWSFVDHDHDVVSVSQCGESEEAQAAYGSLLESLKFIETPPAQTQP